MTHQQTTQQVESSKRAREAAKVLETLSIIMNFQQSLNNIRKKVRNTPLKLPNCQIKQELKKCNDISSFNNLLLYCGYKESRPWRPNSTASKVILKRLIFIILTQKLSLKNWNDIGSHFNQCKHNLEKTASNRWQSLFLLVLIKEHNTDIDTDMFSQLQVGLPSTKVDYNEDKGRHVLASRDIEAGQVILVDSDPLVDIIFDPNQGKEAEVICVQCGKCSIVAFPCPSCPDVLFCSIPCLEAALASHHTYECAPMRLYAILRSISEGMTSTSVGRILPLRMATKYKYSDQ